MLWMQKGKLRYTCFLFLSAFILLWTFAFIISSRLLQTHVLDQRLGILEELMTQHGPEAIKQNQRITSLMNPCLDAFSKPVTTAQEVIPRTLWQTYKSPKLPQQMYSYVESWILRNPGLRWCFSTDADIDSYLPSMFPSKMGIHSTYNSFPLAVMRADFWRYVITFSQGGCYSDVDAIDLRALDDWFVNLTANDEPWPVQSELLSLPLIGTYFNSTWESCRIIIGLENDAHFCQWAFCSVAGHPILETVIRLIVSRMEQERGIRTVVADFVHNYTGPAIFTEGIKKFFSADTKVNASRFGTKPAKALFNLIYSDEEANRKARKHGICFMTESFFKSKNVKNRFESQCTGKLCDGYSKWTDQMADLIGRPRFPSVPSPPPDAPDAPLPPPGSSHYLLMGVLIGGTVSLVLIVALFSLAKWSKGGPFLQRLYHN